MDPLNLASGDSDTSHSHKVDADERLLNDNKARQKTAQEGEIKQEEITISNIDENDMKLKDRIVQCRNIIESLKIELNEEKAKIKKESNSYQQHSLPPVASEHHASFSNNFVDDSATKYSACVDSKLHYDENLMEYEKQLQKYQNTLNMAQLEKKNAIRKQMLAKAYRLKLMEVENQCNIELLRVKQSLQCLEPLQMIASKWKNNASDNTYDLNNFELIPRYPELNMNSGSDINSFKEDIDPVGLAEPETNKDEFGFSTC